MGIEEGPPRRALSPFRRRIETVLLEDVDYRRGGDLMPEVLLCALDSVVSPARILRGHADCKLGNPLHYRRSARALSRIGPLLSDQATMPSHYGVRRDDRGVAEEVLPAEELALSGQSAALPVVEPEPFSLVEFPQDAILFEEVLSDPLLVPVHPTGEDQ